MKSTILQLSSILKPNTVCLESSSKSGGLSAESMMRSLQGV
jgi:hypothetical protein